MASELSEFEQTMRREINAFMDNEQDTRHKAATSPPDEPPAPRGVRSKPSGAPKTGHLVKLAVRTKPLELDSIFEHVSSSISKVEAQLEAEKAARKAGYPIIGYVIETQRL